MLVRHADAASDAAACAAIYAPFVRDTVISLEELPPSAINMEARIERISRTHPWLLAEDAGEVTGFAYASPHRERAAYRWAADVSVYLDPTHHRRGIGSTLYRTLFELLIRQGVQVACAGVTLPNQPSTAMHEALGFKPVGIYRRIGFKTGSWWDVGWWQLELVPLDAGPPAEPGAPARLG